MPHEQTQLEDLAVRVQQLEEGGGGRLDAPVVVQLVDGPQEQASAPGPDGVLLAHRHSVDLGFRQTRPLRKGDVLDQFIPAIAVAGGAQDRELGISTREVAS